MLNYKIKIGLVPNVRDLSDFDTRKGMFEPAKGKERKDIAIKYIKEHFSDKQTEFCDLEWLNKLGLLYKNDDIDKVCEFLKKFPQLAQLYQERQLCQTHFVCYF